MIFGSLLLLLGACLGDVEVPPEPPVVFEVESPTRLSRLVIEGTKPAWTAVLNQGQMVVEHDEQQVWSYPVELAPGENMFDFTTQWPSGKGSREHARLVIVFEPDFPAPPGLDPVDSPTAQTEQLLGGTKQAQTSLELSRLAVDGTVLSTAEIVPLDGDTSWTYDLSLDASEGVQRFTLLARDGQARSSEPLDFAIELDQTPPAPAAHYPLVDEVGVPTNSQIFLTLNEALALSLDNLPEGLLVVRDGGGQAVPSSPLYNPLSHTLVLAVMLNPDTSYTVSPDPALMVDLAGNAASAQDDWGWSFTSGTQDDNSLPNAPTVDTPAQVDPATRRTLAEQVDLVGSKDPLTSIWINGSEYLALDDQASWGVTYSLGVGENELQIVSRSRSGYDSDSVTTTIIRDLVRPAPPTLDPEPPSQVGDSLLVMQGTRETNTSVLYNGQVVVPRGPDTAWVYNADLVPGTNEIELRTRNAAGTLSQPVRFLVDFAQPYIGPVEAGFNLSISFNLRDLSRVNPIQGSFETGANHYSVDAWIEGPLEPGETCSFDNNSKQRQNIKYVATMVHYIGSQATQTNPFWDADYRAPDYLAALVSGGVFEAVGIPRNADRRDGNGFQGGDLVDGTGKILLDSSDLEEIDGVTEATIVDGPYTLEWIPLDRNFQRIEQGEYLVHILLGLDRDPTWVAANDFETCWGDDGFSEISQHRIVRRMSLGAVPYSVTVGQTAEMSGPDAEQGSDQLRYITSQGVTFRWSKSD